MIVIEGTDMVGKTTLAKKLVATLNKHPDSKAHYSHLGILPLRWNFGYDYVRLMSPWRVQDRLFLSELAYGTIARGTTLISDYRLAWLRAQLRLVGGLTIIVTAGPEVLESRYTELSSREAFDLSTIRKVNEKFSAMQQLADITFTVNKENGEYTWPAEDKEFIKHVIEEYRNRMLEHRQLEEEKRCAF